MELPESAAPVPATARDGESYKQLFARADEALYRAKERGRDRVENAEEKRLNDAVPEPNSQMSEMKRTATGLSR